MGSLRFRPGVVLFMLPAFALYSLFFIIPFLRTMYGSLFNWNGMENARFIGFGNYAQLARDSLFLTGIGRVALWALLAIIFKVGSALVLASMLRLPIRGERFFTGAFFVPVVISSAAISLMFTLLYDPDIGLIDVALRGVGLGFLAHAWLSDENLASSCVLLRCWISHIDRLFLHHHPRRGPQRSGRAVFRSRTDQTAPARANVVHPHQRALLLVAGAAGVHHPGDHRGGEKLRLCVRYDEGRPGDRD